MIITQSQQPPEEIPINEEVESLVKKIQDGPSQDKLRVFAVRTLQRIGEMIGDRVDVQAVIPFFCRTLNEFAKKKPEEMEKVLVQIDKQRALIQSSTSADQDYAVRFPSQEFLEPCLDWELKKKFFYQWEKERIQPLAKDFANLFTNSEEAIELGVDHSMLDLNPLLQRPTVIEMWVKEDLTDALKGCACAVPRERRSSSERSEIQFDQKQEETLKELSKEDEAIEAIQPSLSSHHEKHHFMEILKQLEPFGEDLLHAPLNVERESVEYLKSCDKEMVTGPESKKHETPSAPKEKGSRTVRESIGVTLTGDDLRRINRQTSSGQYVTNMRVYDDAGGPGRTEMHNVQVMDIDWEVHNSSREEGQ